jgi:tetratricopeptide (TPR) repeat protein
MKRKNIRIFSAILVLVSILILGIVYSQPRGVLEVMGRVERDNKAFTNGTIKIFIDGVVSEVHTPGLLGRFEFYLQYDKEYIVEFSGPGLITKRIVFNTNMPDRTSRRTYRQFTFVVDLFQYVTEVDLSFFDEELVRIEYIDSRGEFSYAEAETESRLRRASELKRLVEEFLNKKKHYDRLITLGDNQFNAEELRPARESYISASAIFPHEPYPIERIKIIDELLSRRDARERKIRDLLIKAEELLEEGKFDEAEAIMNEVIAFEPSARGQVDFLKQKTIQYRQLAGNYSALIAEADKAFDGSLWRKSLDLYKQALEIRATEPHPLQRVEEINRILTQFWENERKYNAAIEKADNYYRVLNYQNALTFYQEAVTYKPDEKHPRERIEIINRHLFSVQQIEAQYKKLIEDGDKQFTEKDYTQSLESFRQASGLKPAEQYPKERIEVLSRLLRELADAKRRYDRAVEEGDNAFKVNRYANALVAFRTASEIFPDEDYPMEMLAKINQILMDRAEIDAKYKDFIEKGDNAFQKRELSQAKSFFQEALMLKSNERYPAQKIEEIDNLLSQQDINERYANAIKDADLKFNNKNYQNALTDYQEASRIKPNEPYPRNKINEINTLLERQKGIDEQYTNTIAFADRAFNNREYANAKESYQRALVLKPDEAYPKDKISQIDQIMGDLAKEERYSRAIREGDNSFNANNFTAAIAKYREALTIRPNEAYPTGKIAECERLIRESQDLEKRYNDAITEGDKNFSRSAWAIAMGHYQTAHDLKSSELYPKSRIDEINLILAQQMSIDAQYNSLVGEAGNAFTNNSYARAISLYESALQLKPEEAFPREQINMINALIAEQRRIDNDYKEAIANADRLFLSRSYEKARDSYITANELKPNEEYPKNRITEVDRILARQKGVEQTYKDAIAEADKLFNQKNYLRSRDSYRRALEVKPAESYPRNRITEIERILSSQVGESANYTAAIEAGDRYLRERQLFRARDSYQEALSMRANEEYPQRKIIEINELLAKSTDMEAFYNRGFMDVSNIREVISNNVEKRYYFVPFERRRTGSYLMIKGENLSERNIRLFINYGKDKTKYGGFTVSIAADKGVQELRIDISNQRRWVSDECNWISIYPQGGDLEVLQVQVFFGAQ